MATLFEKYPAIFANLRDFPEEFPAWRAFDCEDGWHVLVDVLCERLQDETDANGAPQIVVNQIKQKFSELRFHVREASDRQRAMIQLARSLSSRTCETCGAPGEEARGEGWMGVRCPLHR